MTSFGPYQVLDRVGTGATGTVYRAQARDSGRLVAVKEISAPLRSDPAALDRLRREARLLRGLSHPNIVAVFDWGEDHSDAGVVPYLVTEFLGGGSLREMLDRTPTLSPSQVSGGANWIVRPRRTRSACAIASIFVLSSVTARELLPERRGRGRALERGGGDRGRIVP